MQLTSTLVSPLHQVHCQLVGIRVGFVVTWEHPEEEHRQRLVKHLSIRQAGAADHVQRGAHVLQGQADMAEGQGSVEGKRTVRQAGAALHVQRAAHVLRQAAYLLLLVAPAACPRWRRLTTAGVVTMLQLLLAGVTALCCY